MRILPPACQGGTQRGLDRSIIIPVPNSVSYIPRISDARRATAILRAASSRAPQSDAQQTKPHARQSAPRQTPPLCVSRHAQVWNRATDRSIDRPTSATRTTTRLPTSKRGSAQRILQPTESGSIIVYAPSTLVGTTGNRMSTIERPAPKILPQCGGPWHHAVEWPEMLIDCCIVPCRFHGELGIGQPSNASVVRKKS